MLSREKETPFLGMFSVGSFGVGHSKRLKTPREIEEMNLELHIRKQEITVEDYLTPKERHMFFPTIDQKSIDAQFNATLISQIQKYPMKIQIL